jgi:Fic family protein
MDYTPALFPYTGATIDALQRIERARGVIDSARVLPAQEEVLRRDARVGTIHYSNQLEGNPTSVADAERVVDGRIATTDNAIRELVNYLAALELIDRRAQDGTLAYSPAFLLELHGTMTAGLGEPAADFKPRHEGNWRDGIAIVGDRVTGTVYHEAPPAVEVEGLMEARLTWLEARRRDPQYPPVVLAAVAHFEVAEVHPFADYNGRTARLLTAAVLRREGLIARYLFSPERYYAEHKPDYLNALRSIKQARHLRAWLDFFSVGLALEFERVATRVSELNKLTQTLPLPLAMTPSQDAAIAELTTGQSDRLRIADYIRLSGVSRHTASRELRALANAGVLRASGATRDREYRLPPQPTPARPQGRPRLWDDDRVEKELTALLAELGHWPKYREFKERGLISLYGAMKRSGGEDRWRPQLLPGDA